MSKRFAIRLDPEGWTVFDRMSDRAVLIGARKQQALDFDLAERLAERLNKEAGHGPSRPRNPVSVRRS